ncbi:MAG: LysR substrate-binding domain-containing protein, partial [Kiloniellales bacterium]
MNYAQLRAFHAVAEEGGFTRAAAALNVTQPTLSGQVGALEESYGVKLFERRGRGVELTDIGRGLQEITRRLFDLEQEAEQLLSSARGLRSGRLRVGADAPYHLIPLLAAFNREYPGITLSLSFGNSERVLQELFNRRSDVAMLPDLPADPRLHAVAFRRERIGVFVDRNHPWAARKSIKLQELADQRLILRIAPAVAQAAAASGVARRPIVDMPAYLDRLNRFVFRSGLVMKPIIAAAQAAG